MNHLHGIPNGFRQVVLFLSLFFIGFTPANADTLSAAQDTYVSGKNPNTNYDEDVTLRVNGWGPTDSFVEFDVSSLSGRNIDSSTLVINVLQVKKAGTVNLRLVTSAWSENTLTYNDHPGFSDPVMSFPIATGDAGGTVSVDVTSLVQGWADVTGIISKENARTRYRPVFLQAFMTSLVYYLRKPCLPRQRGRACCSPPHPA